MLSSEPFGFASAVMSPPADRVAEGDAVVALERGERVGVAEVVALHVADRHAQHAACARGGGEGGVGVSVRRWTWRQM